QSQAEQAGIMLRGVVLSNGVGLTRHKLGRIRDLGLRLMISLDGPEAFHNAQRPTIHGQGTYKATIASIERAHELGIELTISVTITGASVAGLPDVLPWLLERGIHFTLNFYRENDCSANFSTLKIEERALIDGMRAAYRVIEANLPRYSLLGCLLDRANLGAAHSRTCAVGDNYLVIDQVGNVAKCQMEIAKPVTTIWASDPLNIIRLDATGVQNVPVDQKEGCRDCEWRYWCTGGCAIATYRATGRYDIRSPNCEIYKALYPDVLRLEGLRLLRYHSQY
ncbi:MAG: SPASM domain-containing protein, partial [Roseiflexaceae bacterium]|nr:SPASM domain-containing protein [Roseiflexaceae bacterium]